jgi:hypothetical protein
MATPLQALPDPPQGLLLTVEDHLQFPEPTLDLRRIERTGPTAIRGQEYTRGDLFDNSTGRRDIVVDVVDIWGLVDFERTTWELRST